MRLSDYASALTETPSGNLCQGTSFRGAKTNAELGVLELGESGEDILRQHLLKIRIARLWPHLAPRRITSSHRRFQRLPLVAHYFSLPFCRTVPKGQKQERIA